MSVSDLSNAVQMSDSLIFTNLKAIFFGKYLSKRAFTASRSPVCRKAEIWKFIEIKGLSVIPSRRTRSSKLLPLGPITASLTFASAGEPKSERIHLQQHNVFFMKNFISFGWEDEGFPKTLMIDVDLTPFKM